MADIKLTLVVACALVDADKRVLLAQRPEGKALAGLWEFPGGKIEPGEDPPSALARELREELRIDAMIGPLIHTETVTYPGAPSIRLEFYRVVEFSGEPVNLEFEQIVWEHPPNLTAYDFLEGDIEFVKKIAAIANLRANSE